MYERHSMAVDKLAMAGGLNDWKIEFITHFAQEVLNGFPQFVVFQLASFAVSKCKPAVTWTCLVNLWPIGNYQDMHTSTKQSVLLKRFNS